MASATLAQTLESVTVSALTSITQHPEPRIYNLTGVVRQTGGCILVFVGPPNRMVEWSLPEGTGTLTPFSDHTDERGQAPCRYDAGGLVETAVVRVTFVP